jgi:hypothetical protein
MPVKSEWPATAIAEPGWLSPISLAMSSPLGWASPTFALVLSISNSGIVGLSEEVVGSDHGAVTHSPSIAIADPIAVHLHLYH